MISEVYNMDCIEGMKQYPDKHFDLCLTDPPYNVGREYNEYNDNVDSIIYEKWCDEWFNEAIRVSKTLVMTVGYKNLSFWFSFNPKHQVIWHKPNQNSPSPLGGFNAYESILVWGENQKRIGHDIFLSNISMQKDAAFHDCPKHLPSWEIILNMFVSSPAKVLDIFMGSQTTRIAANKAGLDFVGFEIDKEYFEQGNERYNNFISQLRMF